MSLGSVLIWPIGNRKQFASLNNYRTISLLSNVGKVIEKLMHQRLNQFLEENKCFYPRHQLGFRLNISTNNALMSIIENIQTRLNLLQGYL